VVANLIKRGFIDGGNNPRPYAIFSTSATEGAAGHTGLVLGIEGDELIIFEEICGQKLFKDGNSNAGIKRRKISIAEEKNYTYAYPPSGSIVGL